jgi:RNA polymerase sigma-70 factor (family 1)
MANNSLLNEQELLAQIVEGNQLAFKKIYDAYFSRTYTFAFHVLHSRELAQEVVQEVMLKIWQMGEELTSVRDLEAFLKTLAKRKAIDALRKQEMDRRVSIAAGGNWQEGHEETEEGILLNETRKILERGIEALPAQQRLVYRLCHQQGLKHEEVAEQLNISPGTVHRHMTLALAFLRTYLKDHTDLAVMAIILRLL